jgi:hypothetical protein
MKIEDIVIENNLKKYLEQNNLVVKFLTNTAKAFDSCSDFTDISTICEAFLWEHTPEGHQFWDQHDQAFDEEFNDQI